MLDHSLLMPVLRHQLIISTKIKAHLYQCNVDSNEVKKESCSRIRQIDSFSICLTRHPCQQLLYVGNSPCHAHYVIIKRKHLLVFETKHLDQRSVKVFLLASLLQKQAKFCRIISNGSRATK